MGSLKPILVVAVLAGIGYVTFITLNSGPPAEPPPEAPTDWAQPEIQFGEPSSEMGTPMAVSPSSAGSAAPPFVVPAAGGVDTSSSAPGGAAPPFYSGPQPTMTMPPSMSVAQDAATTTSSMPSESRVSQATAVIPTSGPPASSGMPDQYPINNPLGAGLASTPAASALATDHGAVPPAESSAAFLLAMEKLQSLLDAGQLADAQLELSKWYGNPQVSAADHAQVVELLDQLAGTVIYSREHLLEKPYEVQPGDRLADIARNYQVPAELLAKINGIDSADQLYPGEVLKVMRGPFKAVINLDKQELTLMLEDSSGGVGRYAGRFPIEIAGGTMVSEGQYVVQGKVANPHWINLGRGLGIHSGAGPSDTAAVAPQSGIRLSQQDIGDVYDMLLPNSRVMIRR